MAPASETATASRRTLSAATKPPRKVIASPHRMDFLSDGGDDGDALWRALRGVADRYVDAQSRHADALRLARSLAGLVAKAAARAEQSEANVRAFVVANNELLDALAALIAHCNSARLAGVVDGHDHNNVNDHGSIDAPFQRLARATVALLAFVDGERSTAAVAAEEAAAAAAAAARQHRHASLRRVDSAPNIRKLVTERCVFRVLCLRQPFVTMLASLCQRFDCQSD